MSSHHRARSNGAGSKPRLDVASILATLLIAASLIFGGSTRGGGYALLFALTAVILAVALLRFKSANAMRPDLLLMGIAVGWLALGVIQVVPLPANIWGDLPLRGGLENATEFSGGVTWRPLSLHISGTLLALLAIIPVVAVWVTAGVSSATHYKTYFLVIVVLAAMSAFLGLAQVKGGGDSSLYFHDITNRDMAVGLFANANHLATLILISIPLLAALVSAPSGHWVNRFVLLGLIGYFLLCAIALYFTSSMAGVLLLVPTTAASTLLLRKGRSGLAIVSGLVAVSLSMLIIGFANPKIFPMTNFADGPRSRVGIASVAFPATKDLLPVGSGVGSFELVYRLFEDQDAVTKTYVNHAHNEYLEVLLETGVMGVSLILAFIIWWTLRSIKAWGADFEDAVWARAASIVIGVVILHSIVDYPLRTPAILIVFGLCTLILSNLTRTAASRSAASGVTTRL